MVEVDVLDASSSFIRVSATSAVRCCCARTCVYSPSGPPGEEAAAASVSEQHVSLTADHPPLSPAVNTTHLHHPPPHPPIPRYPTLTRYPISTFQAPGCPSRPPTCFLCSSHILRSTLPLLLPPSPVHLCQNIGSSRSQLEPHPQGHPKTGGSTWFFIHFLARLARVSSAHFFEAA